MSASTPGNSTNVRITAGLAPAAMALALWAALVAILQWTGALERLQDELSMLGAFACTVAALAYGVDAELRSALQRQPAARLVAGLSCVAAAMSLHPAVVLAFAPAAVVLAAAALARALDARFRSAAAASPGAKPGAP